MVPRGATLTVEPLRRVELDELLIVDDDLPQLDDATLIWAWAVDGGWATRAARIEGERAPPLRDRRRPRVSADRTSRDC